MRSFEDILNDAARATEAEARKPLSLAEVDRIAPQELLNDQRVLDTLRTYYERRDTRAFTSDEEVRRHFAEDRRWRNGNIWSIGRDLYDKNTGGDEDAARLAIAQRVWERLPDAGEAGGRPFMESLRDNLLAGVADPTNLIPGVSGLKVAARATLAGKTALQAAGAAAGKGAVVDAGINAVAGGAASLLQQQRDKELGLRSETNLTEALGDAAWGAAIGGGAGLVMGGIGGGVGVFRGRQLVDDLKARGWTDADIAKLDPNLVGVRRTDPRPLGEAPSRTALHEEALAADTARDGAIREAAYAEDAARAVPPANPDADALELGADRFTTMLNEIEAERNSLLDDLRTDPQNPVLRERLEDLSTFGSQIEAARGIPQALADLHARMQAETTPPAERARLKLEIYALQDEQRRLMTLSDAELRRRLTGAQAAPEPTAPTGDAPPAEANPGTATQGAQAAPPAPAEAPAAPGRTVADIEAAIEQEVLDLLPDDVDDPNVIDALHEVVRARYADELAQAEAMGVGAPEAGADAPKGPMAQILDQHEASPAAPPDIQVGDTTMGGELEAARFVKEAAPKGEPAPGATRVLEDALVERGSGPMRKVFERMLAAEQPQAGPVKANVRAGGDDLAAQVDELTAAVPDHPIKAELKAELARALGNIQKATVTGPVKLRLMERAAGMRIAEAMRRIELATAEAEAASRKGQPRTSNLDNGYVPDTDAGEAVPNIVKGSDWTFTDAAGDERGILRRDKGRDEKAEANRARIAKPTVQVVREVPAAKRHVSQDGVRVKKGETVYVLGREMTAADGSTKFVPSSMTATYYNRQVAEAIARGKPKGTSAAITDHTLDTAAAARAGQLAPELEGKALADTEKQRAGRGELTPDTPVSVGTAPDRKALIEAAYDRFKTHQDPLQLREDINAAVARTAAPSAPEQAAPVAAAARPAPGNPPARPARAAPDAVVAGGGADAAGGLLEAPAPVGQRFALLDKTTQTLRILSNKAAAEQPTGMAAFTRLAGKAPPERFVQGLVPDGSWGDEARAAFRPLNGEDVPAVAPAVKPAPVGAPMRDKVAGLAKQIGADRERLEDKLRGYAAGQLAADDVLDELVGASGPGIKTRLDMIRKLGVLKGKVPEGQFVVKAGADGQTRRGDTIRKLAWQLSREIHEALPELRGDRAPAPGADRDAELARLMDEQALDDAGLERIGSDAEDEAVAAHIDGTASQWDAMAGRVAQAQATDDVAAREARIVDLAGRAAELLAVTEDALERAARGFAKIKPAFDLAAVAPSDTAKAVTKTVERKSKAAVKKAEATAAEQSAQPRPAKPAPAKESPVTRRPDIEAGEAQLRERLLAAQPGSDAYRNTALELYRRILARPEIKAVRLDWETTQMTGPELVRELSRALRNADAKRITEVSYAIWTRGEDLPMQPPPGGATAKAVLRERAQRAEAMTADGIPGGAPASVQVIGEYLRHPDARVQGTQRTLLYRALNLLSSTLKTELDGALVMDLATVYRLAGQTPPAGATGAFLDLTDPAVAAVRRKLARTAKGLADTAIGLVRGVSTAGDAIHEVGHLAIRTLPDEDRAFVRTAYAQAVERGDTTAARVQRDYSHLDPDGRAEEWFSEGMAGWLQERVAKGDVFAARNAGGDLDLALRGRLSRVLDEVVQRVAYLVNGLIGRKSMRQVYRSLTLYGDLLGGGRAPDALGDRARVPARDAAAVAESVQARMDPARRKIVEVFTDRGYGWQGGRAKTLFHGSPHGGIMARDDFAFQPSEMGELGPGIYLTTSESLAGMYAKRGTLNPADAGRLRRTGGEEAVREATDLLGDYFTTAERLEKAAPGSPAHERLSARREHLAEELERRHGVTPEPYVMPVYVRMSKYLDAREATVYDADEDSAVARLLDDLEARQLLDADQVNELAARLTEEGPSFTGRQVYDGLVDAFSRQYGGGPDQGKAALNEALQELGYHGLVGTSTDTWSDISRAIHPDEVVVFKPEHVKHVEARSFDRSKAEVRANIEAPRLTGGALITMAESEGRLSVDTRLSLIGGLEQLGAPADVVKAAIRGAQGRGSQADIGAFRAFGVRLLNSGAERMRRYGAQWVADQIAPVEGAGLYEAVDNEIAKKLVPIFNKAVKLPGAPGALKRYFQSITNPAVQPESHARVLRALRRPDNAAAWAELSAEERAVANDVRAFFREELERQHAAGIPVKDAGPHYVPQVWDAEALAKDPEGAAQAFARYFLAEAAGDPYLRDEVTVESALLSARNLVTKLIDQEGVYLPGPARTNRAKPDHEFQRMIKLQDPRFAANLDELEAFLNPHLMGTVARYARNSTLRIENAKRFGLNSHGVDDYLRVAQLGVPAAVDLLETGRHMRVATRHITAHGIDTQEHLMTLAAPMARPKAIDLVQRALETVRTDGVEAARDLIVRAVEDPSPTFQKRAEAIVAALRDFDGNPHGLPDVEADHVLAAAQRAAGRPVLGDNRTLRQAAQMVKTVNTVTLLSYTTLTSLSDIVMPLIRSGNMRAWLAGVRHIGQDTIQRQAMRNIGLSVSELIRANVEAMGGSEPGAMLAHRLQQGFMNATGLNQWTRMQREISGIVGWEAMKAEVRRARQHHRPGQTQQDRAYRQAMRFLRSYGLEDFAHGTASLEDALGDPTVQRAILKFANRTIFEPNSNDIPMWAQTWWGGLLFQLKSYPLMMGREMKRVMVDAYDALPGDGRAMVLGRRPSGDGNPWPLLYLGTAGTGVAAGAMAVKDLAQSRGYEEDGKTPARTTRERSLAKIAEKFGIEGLDPAAPYDAMAGWWLESLIHLGGLGLVSDALWNVADQMDNGAFGQQRIAGTFLGPTYGLVFNDLVNVGAGAQQALFGEGERNDKMRTGARSAVGRLPVVGQQAGWREAAVELLAGPKADRRKKKGGWGSGWGSGWGD